MNETNLNETNLNETDMNDKTTGRQIALVTGANKGIGLAVAGQFAAKGMTALIGARNLQRGEAVAAKLRAAGGDAYALTLDVTDAATVEAAAKWIRDRFGRLDILVNNAGISGSGQAAPQDAIDRVPSAVDVDVVRAVFETNVFGVIAVTNAMVGLLRLSAAPRIVNISSHAASLTLYADPNGPMAGLPSAAYSPSKTALNAITVQYANELRADGFLVNAIAPGYVNTEINGNTGILTPDHAAANVVRLATAGPDGDTAGFHSEDGPLPW